MLRKHRGPNPRERGAAAGPTSASTSAAAAQYPHNHHRPHRAASAERGAAAAGGSSAVPPPQTTSALPQVGEHHHRPSGRPRAASGIAGGAAAQQRRRLQQQPPSQHHPTRRAAAAHHWAELPQNHPTPGLVHHHRQQPQQGRHHNHNNLHPDSTPPLRSAAGGGRSRSGGGRCGTTSRTQTPPRRQSSAGRCRSRSGGDGPQHSRKRRSASAASEAVLPQQQQQQQPHLTLLGSAEKEPGPLRRSPPGVFRSPPPEALRLRAGLEDRCSPPPLHFALLPGEGSTPPPPRRSSSSAAGLPPLSSSPRGGGGGGGPPGSRGKGKGKEKDIHREPSSKPESPPRLWRDDGDGGSMYRRLHLMIPASPVKQQQQGVSGAAAARRRERERGAARGGGGCSSASSLASTPASSPRGGSRRGLFSSASSARGGSCSAATHHGQPSASARRLAEAAQPSEGEGCTLFHPRRKARQAPRPPLRTPEQLERRHKLVEERVQRHAEGAAAQKGGAPFREPYRVALNPEAGSVFVEIHRILSSLPFWEDLPYGPSLRSGVAALGSLTLASARGGSFRGMLQGADVLLDDRYASDKVISNWARFKPVALQRGDERGPDRLLVNSYCGTKCLTLKSAMVATLRGSLRDPWDITPETHLLNARKFGQDGRRDLEKAFRPQRGGGGAGGAGRNMWILKPSHRNKGIGIKVFDDVKEMLRYVDVESLAEAAADAELGEGGKAKATRYVAQKYIEKPFLIQNRKFDLRSWCVVTPSFDILVYQRGVMRTASEPYDPDDLTNDLSHLTNHCIQETGPNFGKFEEGNEMWYPQFQEYLDSLPPGVPGHGWSLQGDILPQVNESIRSCLLAAQRRLSSSTVASDGDALGCFQLFGFDFMLDDYGKVWLIEINGSPASAEFLLTGMMRSLVSCVVAPMFPAPPGHAYPEPAEGDDFLCIHRGQGVEGVYPSCGAERHSGDPSGDAGLRDAPPACGSEAAGALDAADRELSLKRRF